MDWVRYIVSYAAKQRRRVCAWIRTWPLCNAIRKHNYICSTLSVPRKNKRRTGLRALALVVAQQDALPPFVSNVNYEKHTVEFTSLLGKAGSVKVSVSRPGVSLDHAPPADATWQHRDLGRPTTGKSMPNYKQHTLHWTGTRPAWYFRSAWRIERAVVRVFGHVYTTWIQRGRTARFSGAPFY
jgi:hypothetical protein